MQYCVIVLLCDFNASPDKYNIEFVFFNNSGLLHPIKNKTKTTQPTETKTTTYSKVIVRKSKPIFVRCGSFELIYSAISFVRLKLVFHFMNVLYIQRRVRTMGNTLSSEAHWRNRRNNPK